MSSPVNDPHAGQPVLATGGPLEDATSAVIMLHGRGGSAEDILSLTEYLEDTPGMICLAPQAAGHTWYPYSFLSPLADNEPGLSSALGVVDGLINRLEAEGIPATRVALLGFSQGACLATEYAARHPRRYGAVIGFSGGVIGPPEHDFGYTGSLEGTPVFLGCSDTDPHIPLERVEQTATLLDGLGAAVDKRIYPGMPHTIIPDEIEAAQGLLATLVAG